MYKKKCKEVSIIIPDLCFSLYYIWPNSGYAD